MTIVDNTSEHRFETQGEGDRAELVYERTPHALVLIHTGVPDSMRGGGLGGDLVRFAVASARRDGLRVVVATRHASRDCPARFSKASAVLA